MVTVRVFDSVADKIILGSLLAFLSNTAVANSLPPLAVHSQLSEHELAAVGTHQAFPVTVHLQQGFTASASTLEDKSTALSETHRIYQAVSPPDEEEQPDLAKFGLDKEKLQALVDNSGKMLAAFKAGNFSEALNVGLNAQATDRININRITDGTASKTLLNIPLPLQY